MGASCVVLYNCNYVMCKMHDETKGEIIFLYFINATETSEEKNITGEGESVSVRSFCTYVWGEEGQNKV